MPSNSLILCRPLLLLDSIFPSIRSFPMSQLFPSCGQNIGVSFSNEYSGLISFRTDYFDLLAVQQTLKSLLQHHNLKAPRFHHLAFFMSLLSHLYMTTGLCMCICIWMGLPRWLSGNESACQAGHMGLIPGSGRSLGEGNGNLFQSSSLGNIMDKEAWQATIHWVAKVLDTI